VQISQGVMPVRTSTLAIPVHAFSLHGAPGRIGRGGPAFVDAFSLGSRNALKLALSPEVSLEFRKDAVRVEEALPRCWCRSAVRSPFAMRLRRRSHSSRPRNQARLRSEPQCPFQRSIHGGFQHRQVPALRPARADK
jgi:hypothetical protein